MNDLREHHARAAQTVAQIAIGFTPRLLEGLERSQLSTRCAESGKLRWWRRIATPQEIDMPSHFLQDTQMTLRLGNESGMKGSNGRDVTLDVVEVLVATRGAHQQSRCMPRTCPPNRRDGSRIPRNMLQKTAFSRGSGADSSNDEPGLETDTGAVRP